jgi:hypothetical protein
MTGCLSVRYGGFDELVALKNDIRYHDVAAVEGQYTCAAQCRASHVPFPCSYSCHRKLLQSTEGFHGNQGSADPNRELFMNSATALNSATTTLEASMATRVVRTATAAAVARMHAEATAVAALVDMGDDVTELPTEFPSVEATELKAALEEFHLLSEAWQANELGEGWCTVLVFSLGADVREACCSGCTVVVGCLNPSILYMCDPKHGSIGGLFSDSFPRPFSDSCTVPSLTAFPVHPGTTLKTVMVWTMLADTKKRVVQVVQVVGPHPRPISPKKRSHSCHA